MTGITINPDAYLQADGTLLIDGTVADANGNTDTIVSTVTEGLLTVGVDTHSTPTYGTPVGWSAHLSPIGSPWSYGSAVAVAVLLNANSVQIGYATRELTIQDPPE